FFHAEDGIRGFHVTGVQTCALPISGTASLHLECQVRPFPPLSKNKTFHFAGILESIISLPQDHSCRVFSVIGSGQRRRCARSNGVSRIRAASGGEISS